MFFDNLTVTHTRGPILEETHYYPFGLTMAGISTKALAYGEPPNNWGYQQYEFNPAFDLNLYEAFYRLHDPQLGRFWQIDTKPSQNFSQYIAMINNPLINIDILGDTTIYLNSKGEEIDRANDLKPNAVSFVADKNFEGFMAVKSLFEELGVDISGSLATSILRAIGETYNVESVFDFVDANSDNYTSEPYFSPIDGLGPFINEASAAVVKKDFIWAVDPETSDPTNRSPFASSKVRNGINGITLHTHDNEGRRFIQNSTGRTGTVASGPRSAAQDNSSLPSGTGIFEMAAGKSAIYFYNITGVVYTLNRDAFSTKK